MSNTKNVQSFEKLLGICTGLGGSYNPGQQNLQVKNMNALLTHARQTLLDVSSAKTVYENATDNREVIFSDMSELCTRIIGSLNASGATSLMVDNAKVMTRKIIGTPARDRPSLPPDNPEEVKPKTRRARGLDYATMVHHFEKLLQTLKSEPLYNPNEEELTVKSLMAKWEALEQHNANVITAYVNWSMARGKRNDTLYKDDVNVFRTAMTTKEYVKSVFGAKSEEYKQVRKLEFTKQIK